MQEFLSSNWLSMVSIVIGVIVAYVFYRLQKKDTASASAERKKHANSELLDVIESYIINKQALSKSVIENLIHASERSHLVALRPGCTAITLLQDVALRLQRSRHLDIPQKSEYSIKIDELITHVSAELEPLTWEDMRSDCNAIIAEVIELIPAEKREDVEDKLNTLGMIGVIAQNYGELNKVDTANTALSWMTATAAGVAATFAVSSVGKKLLLGADDPAGFVTTKLISTLALFTLAALAFAVLVYVLRSVKKNSKR